MSALLNTFYEITRQTSRSDAAKCCFAAADADAKQMVQGPCATTPPIIDTFISDSHVFAVTAIAASARRGGATVHVALHSWPLEPPHLPVAALAPSRLSSDVQCSCRGSCCTAELRDPRSPGKHAVILVSQSHDCESPRPLHKVNLTFGIRPHGSATLEVALCSTKPSEQDITADSGVGVCLGPLFRSPARADQQQLVWSRWMEHAQRVGIDRIFAYGLDSTAHRTFGTWAGGLDVVYNDWPRVWHQRVGLPLIGDASQTARLSVSTWYATQPLVLQKCYVEHAHEVEWLMSMDTDEFFQGAELLPVFLRGELYRSRCVSLRGELVCSSGSGVVTLCRGQAFRNSSWFQLAAPKYAMKTSSCNGEPLAFAWVHYGWCGGIARPNHADSFDRPLLAQRCEAAPRKGYLDHSWRNCLMEPPPNAGAERSCEALTSYPNVSYDGTGEYIVGDAKEVD